MLYLLLILSLCLPSAVLAQSAVLGPAANPVQPVTVLSLSAVPFIKASSGTMGNNGAVSAMTALPRTMASGAYLYLPAGAICATCSVSVGGGGIGSPSAAGWYWFVGSSTTAGTVYNRTYTSGTPVRGETTAFAETGPGAFTGATTTPESIVITVPANSLGINGQIQVDAAWAFNGTAGNKALTVKYGVSPCWAQGLTTNISAVVYCTFTNRGRTDRQAMYYQYALNTGTGGSGGTTAADQTLATTTDLTVTIPLNTAVATDHLMLESYRIQVFRRD